jgi:hypothetical protein
MYHPSVFLDYYDGLTEKRGRKEQNKGLFGNKRVNGHKKKTRPIKRAGGLFSASR